MASTSHPAGCSCSSLSSPPLSTLRISEVRTDNFISSIATINSATSRVCILVWVKPLNSKDMKPQPCCKIVFAETLNDPWNEEKSKNWFQGGEGAEYGDLVTQRHYKLNLPVVGENIDYNQYQPPWQKQFKSKPKPTIELRNFPIRRLTFGFNVTCCFELEILWSY